MLFNIALVIGLIVGFCGILSAIIGMFEPEPFLGVGFLCLIFGGVQALIAEEKFFGGSVTILVIEIVGVLTGICFILKQMVPAKKPKFQGHIVIRDPNGSTHATVITDGELDDIGYQNGAVVRNATFVLDGNILSIHPDALANAKSLTRRLKIYGIRGVKL